MIISRWTAWAVTMALVLVTASTLLSATALWNVRSLSADSVYTICATKAYYQGRIRETERFLAENTEEEPIPGITRTSLLRSLESNRGLVQALSNVDCPED